MSVGDNPNDGLSEIAPASDPTNVTSRPSRSQVMPSAITTSQWNRLQGRRSSLAGTSVTKLWSSTRAANVIVHSDAAPFGYNAIIDGRVPWRPVPGPGRRLNFDPGCKGLLAD